MIKGYLSVNDVAEKWNLSPRRVRTMCQEGKIEGASKLGREWAIPDDAERPTDARITSGEYKNWRKKNSMTGYVILRDYNYLIEMEVAL